MTKVYCKDCKYQSYADNGPIYRSYYICLAHPYHTDTFLEKSKSYLRCVDVNTYNNCKHYKEKFWRKVWKSLASGTLN